MWHPDPGIVNLGLLGQCTYFTPSARFRAKYGSLKH